MSSRTVETSISVGHIRDLIIQSLVLNGFVADDEDVLEFKFGLDNKSSKLNSYLDREIPVSYKVQKQKQVKVEHVRYGRKG